MGKMGIVVIGDVFIDIKDIPLPLISPRGEMPVPLSSSTAAWAGM